MTHRFFTSALVLSTLIACGGDADVDPPGPGVDPATQFVDSGSHGVGFTVLEHDRGTAEPLVVKAWYPLDTAESEPITYDVSLKLFGPSEDLAPILGHAVRDGSPGAGSYPLVVLSHGFAMNPEWYAPLAEHLASHGFVVLGPEHVEYDWAADVVPATVLRPLDVSDTIDLAESGVLDGVIDADKVAVVGHSYGGYTALAAAGARIELGQLHDRCETVEDPFTAAYFCEPFADGQSLADWMDLAAPPTGLWPSLEDPRVDAILPMAGDAYLFGEVGLSEVTVPAMFLGGTADTGTPWDWGTGLAFEHVGSEDRTLVALEGAEHFVEVATCDDMPWTAALPPEYQGYFCEDPGWDKHEALDVVNQLSTAFLLHALTGSEEAALSLEPGLYGDVPGLSVDVF